MIPAATLAQVRSEIKAGEIDTSGDPVARQLLYLMTERLQAFVEKEFAPRRKAVRFDALGYHIDDSAGELHFKQPLLEALTVIDGEGTTLALYDREDNTGDYLLPGEAPYYKIALADASNKSWSAYTGPWQDAISVTGIWGYRRNYAEDGWMLAVDTVQNNPLSSGATALTVADADGADLYGLMPRFSPGNLLRIESEYLEVLAVNTSTNSLTVRRGVQGTTAAEHAQNTAIAVWVPEPAITRALMRWVAYAYSRRGQFNQMVIQDIVAVKYPGDLPDDVAGALEPFYDSGWTPV